MNKKRFLYLLLITATGYLFLSWFGILIGLLVYMFLHKIYAHTLLKKEIAFFLHSSRSPTLNKQQKILLVVEYLCARCFPWLDDITLGRLLDKLKLNRSFFHSVEISFLRKTEADYEKLFLAFTSDECRFIFICFSGLASAVNKEQGRLFLLKLKEELPGEIGRLIILQEDLETCLPFFRLLDVEPGSRFETVKRQYKKLAMNFHPDTSEALSETQKTLSGEAYLKIQDSYNKLSALYSSEKEVISD